MTKNNIIEMSAGEELKKGDLVAMKKGKVYKAQPMTSEIEKLKEGFFRKTAELFGKVHAASASNKELFDYIQANYVSKEEVIKIINQLKEESEIKPQGEFEEGDNAGLKYVSTLLNRLLNSNGQDEK